MKIAFTLSDYGAAANIGGDVERRTFIVDVPDQLIPKRVLTSAGAPPAMNKWETLSLSIVETVEQSQP